MTTNNKKLIKNFRDILSSAINAKSLIEAEIEKVDAKYRALAEKEKKDFTAQLKALDTQIYMCNNFLNGASTEACVEEDTPIVEEAPIVEEERVVDNLFEDNNEPEEEPAEESAEESTDEWPEFDKVKDTPAESTESSDEDEWPEEPEEWK